MAKNMKKIIKNIILFGFFSIELYLICFFLLNIKKRFYYCKGKEIL